MSRGNKNQRHKTVPNGDSSGIWEVSANIWRVWAQRRGKNCSLFWGEKGMIRFGKEKCAADSSGSIGWLYFLILWSCISHGKYLRIYWVTENWTWPQKMCYRKQSDKTLSRERLDTPRVHPEPWIPEGWHRVFYRLVCGEVAQGRKKKQGGAAPAAPGELPGGQAGACRGKM